MSEILSVPEENLTEVIKVMRVGVQILIWLDRKNLSTDTETHLLSWCTEMEEYLKRMQDE